MEEVLVTGANGFIGQHLVRILLDSGQSVRAVVQGDHPLYFFRKEEVELREADLTTPGTLSGIANGIKIIYHLAAVSRNDLRKPWAEYDAVNIKGTEALLREAERAGVRRFVFVSTVEAAGYGDGVNPRTEEDPPHPKNNYGKSKLGAEKIVLNGKWKMECVVARLPMIYGPGTPLIVPKLFGMVRWRVYPLIGFGDTKMEFCYVANAVQGLRLCGERLEAAGQLFYISGQRSYTIREVISHVAAAMGCRVAFLRIPRSVAMGLALLWESVARLFPFPPLVSRYSGKPFFTRETVRWTTQDVNIVSTQKIRDILGYQPAVDITEGCRLTAQWLKQQGM